MLQRYLALVGVALALTGGILIAIPQAVLANHDAAALPHGGNSSGVPYFGGQIQSNNYTYYVTERNTAMNNWQTATGRRYVDGFTAGETMTQYVVYSLSQQDTDLANWFGVQTCQYYNVNWGTSGYTSFHFGHNSTSSALNNDKRYSVICLNVTSFGFSPGYDSRSPATRIIGMTHEMGHSIHLAHDTDGVMCTCWSYNINTSEANKVNTVYSSAP